MVSQDSEEVILADQKRLEVDTYSRFRITDPLLFYQTVRNEFGARQRLESIIDSISCSLLITDDGIPDVELAPAIVILSPTDKL